VPQRKVRVARFVLRAKRGRKELLTRILLRMPIWRLLNTARTLITLKKQRVRKVGELKKWRDQDWVRIGTDGKIKGKCGTSKNKKNPDRCLPRSKANSLSKSERASTARKKKREGAKGKTFVKNTKAAEVKFKALGGEIKATKAKRPAPKANAQGVIARGCGKVLSSRRKRTKGSVS
jgi:hypothetical protein